MILETLKNRDPKEASQILAAAARLTLPNPGIEPQPASDSEASRQVVDEIFTRLKLRPDDFSPSSRRKFFEVLSSSLHDSIMSGKNPNEIYKRIGQSGKLSPKEYTVLLPDDLQLFRNLGVRNSHIHDAVAKPDDVQHLTAPADFTTGQDFSIFVKELRSKKSIDSFWLCIFSQRSGATQIVQSAWRVYPSEVDISHASKPLDILRAFSNVYGREIFAGTQKSKFISNERILSQGKGQVTLQVAHREGAPTFSTVSYHTSPDMQSIEIVVAFEIELNLYADNLQKHGVKIIRPQAPKINRFSGIGPTVRDQISRVY
ncbi:MAG: hypothetical protein ACOH12_16690 [Parvibaculaceae bacterium]